MLQARIANLHLQPRRHRCDCIAAVQKTAGFLDDEIKDADRFSKPYVQKPLAAMCGDLNVSSDRAENLMSGNLTAWTRADMPPPQHL